MFLLDFTHLDISALRFSLTLVVSFLGKLLATCYTYNWWSMFEYFFLIRAVIPTCLSVATVLTYLMFLRFRFSLNLQIFCLWRISQSLYPTESPSLYTCSISQKNPMNQN